MIERREDKRGEARGERRRYRVKDVARMTGLSVRALHHYDEIALLKPGARSEAGYRLYDDEDLLRLQQVLIGRELGLSLEDIRRSLDDEGFDRRAALRAQRGTLAMKLERTRAMIAAIDKALAVLDRGGDAMGRNDKRNEGQDVDMKALFDGFDPSRHEAEAQQRWGHTDAWKESAKRAKRYGKEDWQRMKAEQDAIYRDAFAAMQAGHRPTVDVAMDVAERHRLSIDRWFYPCSAAMHAGLADLWENDARFAQSIDRFGAGLTPFLAAAVRANAQRRDG